jgi:hypothetical protein
MITVRDPIGAPCVKYDALGRPVNSPGTITPLRKRSRRVYPKCDMPFVVSVRFRLLPLSHFAAALAKSHRQRGYDSPKISFQGWHRMARSLLTISLTRRGCHEKITSNIIVFDNFIGVRAAGWSADQAFVPSGSTEPGLYL